MRLLLIVPAVLLPAASAAAPAADRASGTAASAEPVQTRVLNPNQNAPTDCPPVSRYHAMKEGERLGIRRLNQLPDADHYKAAYRKIDGCEAPIVADFGVARR